MNLSGSAPKYSKDAPFTDPVVRCDSCQELILREKLCKLGMCPKCGNRRVRNVMVMSPDEWEKVKGWDLDPDWLAIFEAVNDD